MHVNGLPVRWVGEVHALNYATHTRAFLSVAHAVETLRDLPYGCAEDTMLIVRVDAHDSEGEAYARLNDASHCKVLGRGPRGGIVVETY